MRKQQKQCHAMNILIYYNTRKLLLSISCSLVVMVTDGALSITVSPPCRENLLNVLFQSSRMFRLLNQPPVTGYGGPNGPAETAEAPTTSKTLNQISSMFVNLTFATNRFGSQKK